VGSSGNIVLVYSNARAVTLATPVVCAEFVRLKTLIRRDIPRESFGWDRFRRGDQKKAGGARR
jgi:hypothetical protein